MYSLYDEALLENRTQAYRNFLGNLSWSSLMYRMRRLFDTEEILRLIREADPAGEEDPEFEEVWWSC